MATPPSSLHPAKRRRENQNEHEDEDSKDSSATATVKTIESSPNGTEKDKKKKMSPVVVFAHGADGRDYWVLAKELQAVEVVTFDYPYISGGKRGAPPKAEKLVDFHVEVVKKALAKVSCMVAGQEGVAASAVVCLGYPLKGMNGAVRDETLLQLTVPTMFVQGSKDGFCPLEKLELVRKKMKFMNGLHVVEGGDHSFKIAKKHLQSTGSTQEDAEDHVVHAIAMFVSKYIRGSDTTHKRDVFIRIVIDLIVAIAVAAAAAILVLLLSLHLMLLFLLLLLVMITSYTHPRQAVPFLFLSIVLLVSMLFVFCEHPSHRTSHFFHCGAESVFIGIISTVAGFILWFATIS
ncbi:hypothetical protein Vadar_001886 [Vaccinium darrowii]|uniref:Uncharacterized protein n=1 Tax=Vaccinium darrowii TaxID=229202 RepID=A0ACB7XES3_9ERIC|nr:hypothetical protein Vadar_001886 [Vaccinium darrowii]